MTHNNLKTTSRRLRRNTPPMLLFERAKKYGVWNPSDIDFSRDRTDWKRLDNNERDILLRLTALFIAGEEAVALDLLPLVQVIAREGRIEEEIFLSTFLWEEAKHVDFFNRILEEVCDAPAALGHYQSEGFRKIVYEALPQSLNALHADPSPAAQVRASTVYNMVVEGMLAETGYHGYFTIIEKRGILPGIRQGIGNLRLDESRHIAYGVYLISRLMAENPDLWDIVESTMNELFDPGLGVITDIFAHYDPVPFGITAEAFAAYGAGQFQKRLDRIRRARIQTHDELDRETEGFIARGDG
ncbi:MAG TPA: R2-like ligand-binding oxidase [Candidatus Hydrogenedentes bacterium]|nr:R2-like ligand-binding oxidase [Candidatus Hydrogenedentota bacterium]